MMLKLLIVEDEKLLREGILEMIDYQKFPIMVIGEARNGEEAVMMIEKHHPDLVLLDINIPIFNGIEVLKRTDNSKFQIIIITGYAEFSYAKEALSYGAADYLLKPISPEQLNHSIEKIFKKMNLYLPWTPDHAYSNNTKKVLYYIDEHLSSVLTLEVISRYMDVSKDHLNRTFKQDTGITIGQAIIKRRIEKACELLEKTEIRINEIAYLVGFRDYKYFHRVFKDTEGVSPKTYRISKENNV